MDEDYKVTNLDTGEMLDTSDAASRFNLMALQPPG
jgi:hypothetical protein